MRPRKVRSLTRRCLRAGAWACALLGAAAATCWFVGDTRATREAAALYRDNEQSPTRALRLLEQFASEHTHWGRAYADEKIAELRSRAEEERRGMEAEHRAVERDLDDPARDVEFKLARAREFVKKFTGVFDDSDPLRTTSRRAAELERALCALIHKAIADIVHDPKLLPAVKQDRLRALDLEHCGPARAAYLRDLIERASAYLQDPGSVQAHWHLLHAWQRSPADCVRMSGAPTVFRVTLTALAVRLSDAHFKQLKGAKDARPRIDVDYGTGAGATYRERASLHKIAGPVNAPSFRLETTNQGKPLAFYLAVKGVESVRVSIADEDDFLPAPSFAVTFLATSFQRGGSESFTWANGTELTLTWRAE